MLSETHHSKPTLKMRPNFRSKMGLNCFIVEKENTKCTWDLNHDLFSLILHSSTSLFLKSHTSGEILNCAQKLEVLHKRQFTNTMFN